MMVKVFRLNNYQLLSLIGRMAASHGALARGHLFQSHRASRCRRNSSMLSNSTTSDIVTYTEFFAPR